MGDTPKAAEVRAAPLELSRVESAEGDYRYSLMVSLSTDHPVRRSIAWVMFNPSTADAHKNDPTMRRVLDYSNRWGYSVVHVINLYARRASDPKVVKMLAPAEAIGPKNLAHWVDVLKKSDMVMVAWGSLVGPHMTTQTVELLNVIKHLGHKPHCLAKNANGSPAHPLFGEKSWMPHPWAPPRHSPVHRLMSH